MTIRRILVANRGEIAVRIIVAAREMGIRTVAVFSEADRGAAHVGLADESVAIGAPEAASSYLNLERMLEVAHETRADALHPGYGFLSERAELSEACAAAGIRFIGPPASAMRKLGSKIAAKGLAVEVGVPVVPGFFETGAPPDQLRAAAAEIGYPVMLKASAGGGGRGMRVVREAADFDNELAMASDEAKKAFGDGAMMVEKLVERPRHVEVQVLADAYGNVATLFERECSIQRRHQKLIEESPSPLMARFPALWSEMSAASKSLVLGAGYEGAGTVEFIVDPVSARFYFLEVNARLQVEHPVTEWVTGLDLVQWQIRVAQGERLDFDAELISGNRTKQIGHAIEARIVAEDPAKGFLPSVGEILGWAAPDGPGVRVDTGYGAGAAVPRYYDSLLAKVIVHAEDRPSALRRLRAALLDFHILGVQTNIAYLLDIVEHPDFVSGDVDTGFLGRNFLDWTPRAMPPELADILGAELPSSRPSGANLTPTTLWSQRDRFRNAAST